VEWERARSFGFLALALCVGKNQMCLTERWLFTLTHNVLQLPEGGDFEALHCQPSTDFDRSTKLDLTTEPPLLGRCCYGLLFYFPSMLSMCFCNLLSLKSFLQSVLSFRHSVTSSFFLLIIRYSRFDFLL